MAATFRNAKPIRLRIPTADGMAFRCKAKLLSVTTNMNSSQPAVLIFESIGPVMVVYPARRRRRRPVVAGPTDFWHHR